MTSWSIFASVFVASQIAWGIADWYWRCRCGRARRFYYGRLHEAGGVMAARAAFFWVATVIAVLTFLPFSAVFLVLLSVYYTRRWWLHDKDRIRRWATRAAGLVVIDRQRRRLKVEQTTGHP